MTLRHLITPTAPEFRVLAQKTWDEREDLQQVYADPDSEGFDRWIAVNGVLEFPDRFAGYYPPIPAEEHRATGCGGDDLQHHLLGGLDDFDTVLDTFYTFSDRKLEDVGSVLDFGCGCGRVIRWFDSALPDARLCGIDVRGPSVEWNRANLRGEFHVGPFDPPTELPDDQFDLVFALSLFSHFARRSNLAWIRELSRLCKPDGLIIVTTHGAFSLAAIVRLEELQESFGMTSARARELLRALHREEFHHFEMPDDVRRNIGVGDNYGQSFLTEAFVDREWSPFVEVLGCVPARLFRFQDVFALRPVVN